MSQKIPYVWFDFFAFFCFYLMEMIRNDEELRSVKEKRNKLHTIKIWKANWKSHVLHKNFLLKNTLLKERQDEE